MYSFSLMTFPDISFIYRKCSVSTNCSKLKIQDLYLKGFQGLFIKNKMMIRSFFFFFNGCCCFFCFISDRVDQYKCVGWGVKVNLTDDWHKRWWRAHTNTHIFKWTLDTKIPWLQELAGSAHCQAGVCI